MFTLEILVARLMDLESRFYELQDKYQNLIDSYEKLKETHEAERSGCWINLTKEEIEKLFEDETKARGVSFMGKVHIEIMILAAQALLKDKNEKNCSRHRDELGTRYDPFVRNSGH